METATQQYIGKEISFTRTFDARKGGAIRIDMRGPDGSVHITGGHYEEVVPYERVAFVGSVLDDAGKPLFEILNTITLTEKDGKTVQVNTARVLTATGAAPQFLQGMQEGWKQSLEKLEAYARKAAR